MGFWDEEIFISLYRAAQIMEQLGYPEPDVIEAYIRASDTAKTRAEAFHAGSRFCRVRQRFEEGYQLAQRGLKVTQKSSALFAEQWIYDYGLLDELAVNAFWTGRYRECVETCERILREERMPQHMRERVVRNMELANAEFEKKVEIVEVDTLPSSADHLSTPTIYNANMNTLHLLGVPHTVVNSDYFVCAFTAKLMLFPEIIQPFGWSIVEYSNQGSMSNADRHVTILSEETLRALSKRTNREDPHGIDADNPALQAEFQRLLVERLRNNVKPGEIICHVWGPNIEVFNLFPECHHIELSVGYTASPGLPFRVFESSAWMHWHYGKAGGREWKSL